MPKKIKPEFTIEDLEEMYENNEGVCTSCWFVQEGVEPDATDYKCECCGEHKVQGMELLLLGGYV